MNNKTVMITGAGRGIGEAAAKAFLEEGYHVIAAGRTVPGWLTADAENLTGSVNEYPTRDQIDVPVNEVLIVELYSK